MRCSAAEQESAHFLRSHPQLQASRRHGAALTTYPAASSKGASSDLNSPSVRAAQMQ